MQFFKNILKSGVLKYSFQNKTTYYYFLTYFLLWCFQGIEIEHSPGAETYTY